MAAPPFSPLSMSSNDSSFVGRYGSISGPLSAPIGNDPSYAGGPYGAARPLHTSPPSSQHPSGSTDVSRPSASGSSNRPPSSASSVGMSSDGRMGVARPPRGDSARLVIPPSGEDALQRHYAALKHYLAESLQDEKGNMKPNRARDKLLRLSVTQFMELSTDVYDELIRREDDRTQRVDNVPRFLLPKQNFHPKRNQARQKLSTLPTERFRQLATDVFYELERRIPRFAGGNITRPQSASSTVSGRSRAASRPGMPPYGAPPPGTMGRGGPSRMGPNGPISPYGPGGPGPRSPSEAGSLGRPLPKHLQGNMIVPNKSTMVEDDDMDDDEDAFGLDHVAGGIYNKPMSAEDRERMQAQESEITQLKEKIQNLEAKLLDRDQELEKRGDVDAERAQWASQRETWEQKHLDAQNLTGSLQNEIAELRSKSRDDEEIKDQHGRNLEDLHEQMDDLHEQLGAKQDEIGRLQLQIREGAQDTAALSQLHNQIDELRSRLQDNEGKANSADHEKQVKQLQDDLAKQQKLNMEVREEAMVYLREMKELSRQNDEVIEQEERLAAKVAQLEKDNDIWRQRCAKIKAQNKSLRASTMGLGIHSGPDTSSILRQGGLVSDNGLIRDTDVTRFQLAVDELVKVGRQTSTEAMLDSVKSVVVSVQSITSAVRTEGIASPVTSPITPDSGSKLSVPKLTARVNGTANSLITATKQHAASHGLSPVALLDAAASNLTAAVVELIKAAGIRPTTDSEFQGFDAADNMHSFYDDGLSPNDDGNLSIPVPKMPTPRESSRAALDVTTPTSATSKKNAGWFGWAGKWGDGSTDDRPQVDSKAPSTDGMTANGNGHAHNGHAHKISIASSGSDYDPYR